MYGGTDTVAEIGAAVFGLVTNWGTELLLFRFFLYTTFFLVFYFHHSPIFFLCHFLILCTNNRRKEEEEEEDLTTMMKCKNYGCSYYAYWNFFIFFLYLFLLRPIGLNVESWSRPIDSITVTKHYSSINTNRPIIPESYPDILNSPLHWYPQKRFHRCVTFSAYWSAPVSPAHNLLAS